MSEGEAFWEARYAEASPESTGRPSDALVRFAGDLPPGRSLDLGCARGDDVVWLARRGWSALGVDVSASVLRYARANAAAAGVEASASFERHDLATSGPDGRFDLVTASFLQSPVAFPRHAVLARAARAVEGGGLFLSVSHGSHAPWSWGDPSRPLPSAEEELAALGLAPSDWERVFVGVSERVATGPGGQTAPVLDTLVAVQRR